VSAYDDNGRWRYRFSFKGKRYGGSTLEGNNTKRAAIALERAHIEKLEAGVHVGKMPTVREFIERFNEHQRPRVKLGTYTNGKQHLEHVEREIGSKLIDDVDTMTIDRMVTTWSKSTSPRTINVRLAVLHHVIALAVEWRVLRAIPVIRHVKVPEDTPRYLTEDEARRLVEACPRKIRSMVFIGLRTGLRVGELRGLQWADVDFERSVIRVRRTDPGNGTPPTAPKGGKHRTVSLTPDARVALWDELAIAAKRGRALPDRHIWPGRDPLRPRSCAAGTTTITAAYRRAKIKPRAGDHLGWHTLRHTFASWLVLRGVSLRVVQDLLGHSTIRQTERYAHLAPDATHHSAVASLDFALAPASTLPMLPSGEGDDDGE
jgi:integrase